MRVLQRDSKASWAGRWWPRCLTTTLCLSSHLCSKAEVHPGLHMALVSVCVCPHARVQPRWNQGIRRWGRSRRPGKNLVDYRYGGRLGTDSVVEKEAEFRWENGEQEKTTRGNQSFRKLIRFLYFSGLFIYLFVIHRDEYRVTWGSADLTLVTIRCFI